MEKLPYRSLVDGIRHWAEHTPEKDALIVLPEHGDAKHVTYRRFHADACRYADALRTLGVNAGELALLVFPHSYDVLAAFFGAIYARAIPAIFFYAAPQTTPEAYQQRVKQLALFAEARAIITTPELTDDLKNLLSDTECQVLGIQPISTDDAVEEIPRNLQPSGGENIAYVQFSSGTTGLPKGVMLSHKAVLQNVASMYAHFKFTSDDVFVNWLPLSHDLGLVFHVLTPLMFGASSVIISPAHWVRSPKTLLWAVHRYTGTVSMMPNFAFNHCVRGIRERDLAGLNLSSWRLLGNAAEPVDYGSIKLFYERFTPYGFPARAVFVGYGLAENVVGVSATLPNHELAGDWVSIRSMQEERRAIPVSPQSDDAKCVVSCGYPLPAMQIRIVDDDGNPLPERYVGEVMVGGPSVLNGYYRRPDLMGEIMRDGWFLTGDIGYLANGQLYICDRKKDLLIVGGKNVYPTYMEEIAAAILGETAGRIVAFGLPDSSLGTEVPVLVCELKRQLDDAEQQQLARQIRQRIYEELDVALADWRFVKRGWIEKTANGKLARAANRAKYLDAGFTRSSEHPIHEGIKADQLSHGRKYAQDELVRHLVNIFEEVLGIRPIGIRDNFFEIGGNSLLYVRLFGKIEETLQHELAMDDIMKSPTIEHIANTIRLQTGISETSNLSDAAHAAYQYNPFNNIAQIFRKSELSLSKKLARSFKVFRRVALRNGPVFGQTVLPYHIGAKFLDVLCGNRLAQSLFFGKPARLMREFLSEIACTQPESEVLHVSLITHIWKNWRLTALARSTPQQFQTWVGISGLDILERAYQHGRGVILLSSHVGLTQITRLVIERMKIIDFLGLGNNFYRLEDAELKRMDYTSKAEQRKAEMPKLIGQLYKAKKVLERGGMIGIAGDGYHGDSGVTIRFHGHRRHFRAGFAELALKTGAEIVPVFLSMTPAGQIQVTLLPPLDAGSAEMGHDKRVESLIRQYAAQLEQYWADNPGNVTWKFITRFLESPRWESEKKGEIEH